jgi:hypothetical protein
LLINDVSLLSLVPAIKNVKILLRYFKRKSRRNLEPDGPLNFFVAPAHDISYILSMGDKRTYGKITRTLTARLLEELYLVREQSLEDIARTYGCTRQMIDLLMEKYGIKRRERISAVILARRKGKFRNAAGRRMSVAALAEDRRREERSTFPHAVEYTVTPGAHGEIFRAMCVDISSSGLCLYLRNCPDEKQKIVFKSGMPAPHRNATVRWCSRMKGDFFKAGLMFSETGKTTNPVGEISVSK